MIPANIAEILSNFSDEKYLLVSADVSSQFVVNESFTTLILITAQKLDLKSHDFPCDFLNSRVIQSLPNQSCDMTHVT